LVMTLLFDNKHILMLGAHPDDVECGMGGTVHRFKDQFKSAQYVVLSSTLEFPQNRGIDKELQAAAKLMGIRNLQLMDYPWMEFHSARGKIRQFLFELNKKSKPDMVFIPSNDDVHQDHEVLSQEAFRIFRDVSVLAYEVVRSSLHFSPNLFISLRKQDLDAKISVLQVYKTQRNLFYLAPHVVQALAVTRGTHSREKFAEAFEIMRLKV
jgi:LmbE family N-acetylglucosaminyl deacetylase